MPVPRCPVCDCEAADFSQQEMPREAQSVEKSDTGVVICHCLESHRFVVSLEKRVLAELRCDSQRDSWRSV